MPHDHPPSPEGPRSTWVYVAVGAAIVVLAFWGVAAYRGHQENATAVAQAESLQRAFARAKLPQYPDTDTVVGLYGADGGAVCEAAGRALPKALLRQQLANGAGGPAQRGVVVDAQTLAGELLVLQTYCLDRLGGFDSLIEDLHFDDVVRN